MEMVSGFLSDRLELVPVFAAQFVCLCECLHIYMSMHNYMFVYLCEYMYSCVFYDYLCAHTEENILVP